MTLANGYFLNQRYRILDILGQGGMGAVYRAIDENLDVTVAVKENAFLSEDYARQFQREAKILAALRHPNLPRVFDYFVIDQQGQYLVMDYIAGEDLRQWMSSRKTISEIEAILIGISICDALIYMHAKEPAITHRDIKPGNIKITPEGEVVLVDFGLVKLLDSKENTTSAARAMTPGYSPPEQYGESSTDHRSDIFSLGATLYAALAGYPPEDSLARATGKTTLTPLKHYHPQISRATASAIEKALKLQFEDRWQSAAAFKETLLDARKAFPKSEWENHRLKAGIRQGMAQDYFETYDNSDQTTPLERIIRSISDTWKKLDKVWLIFGLIIISLVLMLGLLLLKPEGFQRIFLIPILDNLTETSDVLQTEARTAAPQMSYLGATQSPDEVRSQTAVVNNLIASQTPTGGGVGMIAYVSEQSGMPQIWLLDVASGEQIRITNFADGACQPDWSPEGNRIVFISPCSGKRTRYPGSSLIIFENDENLFIPLPVSLEGNFDPAWAPDGRWIAYTSLINGKMQLMKIRLDDFSTVRLSEGSFDDSNPAWSRDGERLAFVRNRGVGQIWLMDADGSNPVQFTLSGLYNNSHPKWFPAESLILYSQVMGKGSPNTQLFGMRLEDIGREEEYPILPAARSDYIPLMDNVDISPDGFWLAFDYWYFNVLSDIYIMTLPGANLTQLTDHPGMDYDPTWRPLP